MPARSLFIIGAGASAEFKFPTGRGLITQIARTAGVALVSRSFANREGEAAKSVIRNYINTISHSENHGGEFPAALYNALASLRGGLVLAQSIDNFLNAHNESINLVRIGKICIVDAILKAERSSDLYINLDHEHDIGIPDYDMISKAKDTWMGVFCRNLFENHKFSEIGKMFENIKFVIFNYDRCVEHFLLHAVGAYYNINLDLASETLSTAVFIHPYGSLGKLPWQALSKSDPVRAFGAESTVSDLEIGRTLINTFTEGVNDSEHLAAIRREVMLAQKIYFLGFGYHSINIDLLKVQSGGHMRWVKGTSYQLSNFNKITNGRRVESIFDRSSGYVDVNVDNDMKCADFLEFYSSDLFR